MEVSTFNSGKADRGSVPLFFLLFVMPILFFLLSISADLAAYYHEEQSAQRVADDAGLYAYRFLPYTTDAVAAAKGYLARYGNNAEESTVSIVSDGVQIETSRSFPLFFGDLLSLPRRSIPVRVVSRVRSAPLDIFIALDTSSYMAPPFEGNATWGNPVDWPPSHYFENLISSTGIPLNARVATQQCFNEGFSRLKRAAIASLDYLSGFTLNSVGVGIYSGDSIPLEIVRGVRGFDSLPTSFGEDFDAQFVEGRHPWIDSIDCAAAAVHFDAPDQYRIPPISAGLPARGNFESRPLSLISPGVRKLDPAYLPYLQAREVIWAQMARPPRDGASAELVSAAFAELMHAKPIPARKGLADIPARVAIIFSGDVPHESGAVFPEGGVDGVLRQAVQRSFLKFAVESPEVSKSELIFVVLRHEGVPDRGVAISALQRLFDEEAARAGVSPGHFRARAIYASDSGEVLQTLIQSLTLLNKTLLLSL